MNDNNTSGNHVYSEFPFNPYPQQRQLMEELYKCIKSSCVGCFESPTGTGKSLSTIFASLTWLLEEETEKSKMESAIDRQSTGDWLQDMQQDYAAKLTKSKISARERLDAVKERIRVRRAQVEANNGVILKQRPNFGGKTPSTDRYPAVSASANAHSDDDFAFPENDSSEEDARHSSDDSDAEDFRNNCPQILYCSRTHSQLSQFVSELKRTPFANIRCVVLGGRRNLCINSAVNALKSDSAMTEKCLKLQKKKSIPGKEKDSPLEEDLSCRFKNKPSETAVSEYILGKVLDIEELASLGRKNNVCPYYASRRAIRHAQLICMPYNLLLSQEIRDSIGIELKGRVVLIDEAHNLVETINQIHSAEVSLVQLLACRECVAGYLSRFASRLSGKNMFYLNLFQTVISSIIHYLNGKNAISGSIDIATGSSKAVGSDTNVTFRENNVHDVNIMTVNEFVFASKLDNINILKMRSYLMINNMVHRIGGFMDHQQMKALSAPLLPEVSIKRAKTASGQSASSSTTRPITISNDRPETQMGIDNADKTMHSISYVSALRNVMDLLHNFASTDGDGRIIVYGRSHPLSQQQQTNTNDTNIDGNCLIKYVLLNPAISFRSVTDQARSVCLLGGTMQPFSYIVSQLFSTVLSSRIKTFSCSHVVDSKHVCPIVLRSGPSNVALELTHAKKLLPPAKDDIINSILRICRVVPRGMVVFFASYAYMETLIAEWKRTGYLDLLNATKRVFVEPRASTDTEEILSGFSNCIAAASSSKPIHALAPVVESCTGAILFCVMGGKLSEGINFSDDLARCVVVVGLPYPDKRDPILSLKLAYADRKETNGGKLLYDALCMRAVNQSVGRSIRHAGDYASMVLIDSRYAGERIQSLLPSWINQRLKISNSLAECEGMLMEFFREF